MNSDMTTFHYKGKDGFEVGDCWSKNDHILKLDNGFNPPGTINVTGKNMGYVTLNPSDFDGYNTMFIWEWTKDVSNPDQYDWTDAKNIMTNNGLTGGSWGKNGPNKQPTQHIYRTNPNSGLTFTDGSGLTRIGVTSGLSKLSLGMLLISILMIILI